ncbi:MULTISPECIES: thioesterase family protein [unclassified Mesorhizobium]|uniref:thioesterase family protein n=1 Tax=unclassified Mesorhizobium TaxID=325217 RepID=UPI00333B9609
MAETYDAPIPWTDSIESPLLLFRTKIRPEWIDVFEHVNTAHYLTICDHANWAFWNWINGPEGTMDARGGHEYVIVQNCVSYVDELALGTPIHVTTQLVDMDDKRYVLFHRIWKLNGEVLAATNEVKCLAFNLIERRPNKWRPIVAERLEKVRRAHAELGVPEEAGKGITLKRK